MISSFSLSGGWVGGGEVRSSAKREDTEKMLLVLVGLELVLLLLSSVSSLLSSTWTSSSSSAKSFLSSMLLLLLPMSHGEKMFLAGEGDDDAGRIFWGGESACLGGDTGGEFFSCAINR